MGFTKHFASPQQTSIDALHTGFTRIRRKASMVHQTMPLTLVFNQFGGRFFIPPSVQHLIDGLGYAQGIIKNAKGIDVAREFIFHKSCSNVFRKARTHEQKWAIVRDFHLALRYFYGGNKAFIHGNK
jgi:hypothetical protein